MRAKNIAEVIETTEAESSGDPSHASSRFDSESHDTQDARRRAGAVICQPDMSIGRRVGMSPPSLPKLWRAPARFDLAIALRMALSLDGVEFQVK
jgi:hypothetical protein